MASRLIKRSAHRRSLGGGRVIAVRASWVLVEGAQKGSESYRHACPVCGAAIISAHMSNGGWAHFEGRRGMGRIKHPCLHLGEGLSRKRDQDTPDLFQASK